MSIKYEDFEEVIIAYILQSFINYSQFKAKLLYLIKKFKKFNIYPIFEND